MKLTRAHMTILGGVLAAALAAPASSLGAVTIGSSLSTSPNDNLPCMSSTVCTATNLSSTTPAVNGLTSPIDGVVVKWSTKSGSAGNPVTFRVLRPGAGASYTGVATGTTGTTTGSNKVDTFSTQTSIKAGDAAGINPGNSALVFAPGTAQDSVVTWQSANGFANGLTDGATGTGSVFGSKQVMVQAVVEPDADNDGLGDETQDPCPTQAGAVCTTANPNDRTAPKISGAKANPKKFAVNKLGQSAATKKATPKGTTFRYKLSEPATVTFRIERKTSTRKNGKRRTVYKRVGKFTMAGAKGKNAQPFSGKIKKKALKAGSYRAVLNAVDGSKNKSKTAKAKFKIVK